MRGQWYESELCFTGECLQFTRGAEAGIGRYCANLPEGLGDGNTVAELHPLFV